MSTTAVAVAPVAAPAPLPVGRLASVGAVIFFANAALLVLQLVASKLLAPFIGSSLETWTSIIGVFLTGIALGNGFGGRLADRYPSPRTLALLLMLGSVAALWMLLFPTLLNSTGAHKAIPLGPRIPVLAVVLCLPAGFALSLLTPLAIKLGLPDVAHTGRVAGLIFALSTLGCLIGNYLTGFYLIPSFTINTLVLVSAGVLIVLGALSLAMVKTTGPSALPGGAAPTLVEAPAPANPNAFPDIRRAYLIVFLASFCGMTLELTASRVLAENLGVSLFTWTGIIGVMLAGTALGNFTGGQIADRVARPGARFSPRIALAATLIAAGLGTVFIFVSMGLITHYRAFASWEPISQVMAWTFSLFFLPMFALGLVSPQVIRLSVPDVAHAGRVAGRVYAWSTAGAIAGTFAAGYVLLSTLGMRHTILCASLLLTLSSLLVANIWSDTRASIKGEGEAAGYDTAGAGALLYLFATALGGIVGGIIITHWNTKEDYIARVESNYYTIKVVGPVRGAPEGARSLYLDHLLHSVVDPDDPTYIHYEHEHTQMEFLWLAKSAAPEPKALVIGGGGYTFPRFALETVPEARMDVVEIDPKVTEVARDYLGLKDYPGMSIHHMDGRQFVSEKAAPGSYDLVIQDAVNDYSVPAHLMTKEYNDAVKAALKPGSGVYLLTIIDSVAQGKLWKAGMATLSQSFAHVVLLSTYDPGESGSRRGSSWDRDRQVLVIYASDAPFSLEALRDAAPDSLDGLRRAAGFASAPVGADVGSPEFALRFAMALRAEEPRIPHLHTVPVPAERIKPFTDREPGLILTDQFCPVDNLMAGVFRARMKGGD